MRRCLVFSAYAQVNYTFIRTDDFTEYSLKSTGYRIEEMVRVSDTCRIKIYWLKHSKTQGPIKFEQGNDMTYL